jgi:hypothetical protein
MYFSPFRGERYEATNVAIDDDTKTIVAETQPEKESLIDLAWSRLYTKVTHKDLGAISTVIRKSRPTTAGTGIKKTAKKLRDQLKSANHTVVNSATMLALSPRQSKADHGWISQESVRESGSHPNL